MISYDPDKVPDIDPAVLAEAMELGMHPFHVICDEPGAKTGDAEGVSFFAFGHFVPRIGERIHLQDGTRCEVQQVAYKTSMRPGTKLIHLVPNVIAVRM